MAAALEVGLEEQFPEIVRRDVDLSQISRWRIGGRADVIVRPRNLDELSRLRAWLHANGVAHMVIGSTTNLLFSDAGLRAVCIQIGSQFAEMRVSGDHIHCDAGVWAPALARRAMQDGLHGIEHICGIPGTMGGLVVMNGGSQRRGISEVIVSVTTVDTSGGVQLYQQAECDFSYRHSRFQQSADIIAGVGIALQPLGKKGKLYIRQKMLEILGNRRRKFPKNLPNCGSVFVSNPAFYAEYGPPGAVIERMGLKGIRIGGAQVSPRHANFIVNTGGARSSDVLDLIALVRDTVQANTGWLMEVEARYVLPNGVLMAAGDATSAARRVG